MSRPPAEQAGTLFVHRGALGDWVLTWPTLAALPRPLAVVTDAGKARLAARCLTGLLPLDAETAPWTVLHARGGCASVGEAWRSWFSRLACVVSYVSDGTDNWAANLAVLAPQAKRAFVRGRPPLDWSGHVIDWQVSQMRAQGMAVTPVPAPAAGHPLPAGTTGAMHGGAVVVHPGSGGEAKCWPRERFAELIDGLQQRGHRVRVLMGEVEIDRWSDDSLHHWQQARGAVVCRSLDELHRHTAVAAAFIGNDTGPTHLAGAIGVPTLALFGPTDPAIWRPWGPRVRVLAPAEPAPMTSLPLQHVLRAFDALLASPATLD
jgi:hypothetical protein